MDSRTDALSFPSLGPSLPLTTTPSLLTLVPHKGPISLPTAWCVVTTRCFLFRLRSPLVFRSSSVSLRSLFSLSLTSVPPLHLFLSLVAFLSSYLVLQSSCGRNPQVYCLIVQLFESIQHRHRFHDSYSPAARIASNSIIPKGAHSMWIK